MNRSVVIAVLSLFAISCGNNNESTSIYRPPVKLCDPELNPSACPQNLIENSRFSRTFTIGDKTAGIEVTKPTPEKIAQTCQNYKVGFLNKHLDNKDLLGQGLFQGEFIASAEAIVKDQGKHCRSRNIMKKCTRYDDYVRIACVYNVHYM